MELCETLLTQRIIDHLGFLTTQSVWRVRSAIVPVVLLSMFCDGGVAHPPAVDSDVSAIRPDSPSAKSSEAAVAKPLSIRDAARWNDDIAALEQKAAAEPNDPEGVLVIGSSSIRRWGDEAMSEAMRPYRTIRRGYGGASYVDIAVFARRLIEPEDYRALVLFAGNDVRGQKDDQSPDVVEQAVRRIIEVSRSHRPDAPILLIEVTPTPQRFFASDALIDLNHRLRKIALTTPGVHFLATWQHYVGDDALPRTELFGEDRLHQNDRGYELWSRLIRGKLSEILGDPPADNKSAP